MSLDEVSIALHSIGPLKAPGPDGLHALFFQHFWPQVKDTIFNLVKDFFENGSLQAINHTLITSIPKVETPELVDHFRPISLCNVIYKVISKILVNRLRPLLQKCISPNQGAFAPCKYILDNILIAHELFYSFNKKKGRRGSLPIKLELEKAYDFLNWKYIRHCLLILGFHSHWISFL